VAAIYIIDYFILPVFNIILTGIIFTNISRYEVTNYLMLYTNYFGMLNSFRFLEFIFIILPILKNMRSYLQVKEVYLAKSIEEL
jgi:hypothetical protein